MSPDGPAAPQGFVPFDEDSMPGESWPELDTSLLEEGRAATVPAFPLPLLPAAWQRWIADTAQSTGTPVDYVVQGLFAAVAAVCGAGVELRATPGWSEPLVLWQALVGMPSSGKSPALAAVRRLLGAIEDELRESDGQRRLRHDTEVEQAHLLAERWKDECAEAVAGGRAPPDKPAAAVHEGAFVPSQIVVADATVEALVDVVSGNPRGVVLWRDELAAWLANQCRYTNGGSDRAHWLEAWSAAGITINRRNRTQPLHLRKFPVSIVGTIQPDRIADAFVGGDDGLAARFLYVWPAPADYTSLMERCVPQDDEALALLQAIARAAGTPDAPLTLAFDGEAMLLLDGFLGDLHRRSHEADGLEAGWLGKGAGTVVRLAGVLALLAWSEGPTAHTRPGAIGREPVQRAIALWHDYLRLHARQVFNQAGRSDGDRHARRVVRWLRTTGTAEVSREQIRREALAHAVDAEGADKVIARLARGGILRAAPAPKGRGRPARRWSVNPAVAE